MKKKAGKGGGRVVVWIMMALMLFSSMPVNVLAQTETVAEGDAVTQESAGQEFSEGTPEAVSETGADGSMDANTVIENNESGIPDTALYQLALQAANEYGNGNGDNELTVAEAQSIVALSFNHEIRNYMGLGTYLTGLNNISFAFSADYPETEKEAWVGAADSFLTEYEKLNQVTSLSGFWLTDQAQLAKLAEKNTLNWLGITVGTDVTDVSALGKLSALTNLQIGGDKDKEDQQKWTVDLSALNGTNFPNLIMLSVYDLNIPTIPEGIGSMSSLISLYWIYNNTNELADLSGLEGLNLLMLRGNELTPDQVSGKVPEKFYTDPAWIKSEINWSDTSEPDEDDGEISEIITNDEDGIPDAALYAAALHAGDEGWIGNKDGQLTMDEARNAFDIRLPYAIRDYTGLSLLSGLTSINFSLYVIKEDGTYTYGENHWDEAADSFFEEYAKMPNLRGVSGDGIQIENNVRLKEVAQNQQLTCLTMQVGEEVTDWSVLGKLELQQLYVNHGIPNLSQLKDLEDTLHTLAIRLSYDDSDTTLNLEVGNFVNLLALDISGNLVSITGLENLAKLRYLYLRHIPMQYNNVAELDRLPLPKSLQGLGLYYVSVKDLSECGISQLTALQELRLENTGLQTLEGLENLKSLTTLDLIYNKITEIAG